MNPDDDSDKVAFDGDEWIMTYWDDELKDRPNATRCPVCNDWVFDLRNHANQLNDPDHVAMLVHMV